MRASVTAAADGYLSTMAGQGYAVPIPAAGYVWGSNSAVTDNAIVMATAQELTGDPRYRAGCWSRWTTCWAATPWAGRT